MITSPRRENPGFSSWIYFVVAVVLACFANGRWLLPLAAWLTPVFFLQFIHRQSPLKGLVIGGIGMLSATFICWYGMTPLKDDPMLYALVFDGIGLIFWLPYCVDRLVSPRIQGFASTLVFPSAFVAMELILTRLSPFFSWGSLAYTQVGWLSLIQIASLTGIWGITFLIAWTAAVIHWAWKQEFAWNAIRAGACVYLAVFASVIVFGQIRLAWFQPHAETIRVGTVAASKEDIDWLSTAEKSPDDGSKYFQLVLDHYLDRTRTLARLGVQIVVWDEAGNRTTSQEESSVIEKGRTLAREENIYLLMGLWVEIPPDASTGSLKNPRENKAVLIGPDGSVLLEYRKANPMPGTRDVHGDKNVGLLNTPIGVLGSILCYDMDNPGFIRQAGRARVGLLLAPTWDWLAIENFHMDIARMRAVENGFSIVRPTREGYSVAFDGLGRVLALSGRNTADRTMIADVPVESVWTPYSVAGDWFGWLCGAGLIGLILISCFKFRPAANQKS